MNSSNKLFSGSITALVTPMQESGAIDFDSFSQLIEWQIASGTHGLVIMGTTGESSLVSKQEHLQAIKVAIDVVQGRIPVIAGCGSAATASVLELVGDINQLGVDGYLCVTPYYVKPSAAGLQKHYELIADACAAPVLLYNVPGRTACDLKNETVIELAKHANIVGIKDAVGDVARAKELFNALGDEFIYLSGDDATSFDFMLQGGDGVISVTSNIAPKAMAEWCHLLLKNRDDDLHVRKAAEIFSALMPLHHKLFIEANPIPAKWLLNQMGKIPAGIRLPLTHPHPQSQTILLQALQQTINAI